MSEDNTWQKYSIYDDWDMFDLKTEYTDEKGFHNPPREVWR